VFLHVGHCPAVERRVLLHPPPTFSLVLSHSCMQGMSSDPRPEEDRQRRHTPIDHEPRTRKHPARNAGKYRHVESRPRHASMRLFSPSLLSRSQARSPACAALSGAFVNSPTSRSQARFGDHSCVRRTL
jgi:hypothetical protein